MPTERPLSDIQKLLDDFVPDDFIDAHAHLAPPQDLNPRLQRIAESLGSECGLSAAAYSQGSLRLLPRPPRSALLFGLPRTSMDRAAANRFVRAQLPALPAARGLMLISPRDDPAAAEEALGENWLGFKPYHLFADSENTYEAEIDEYLPEWAWELAHRHQLVIMLHLVRRRALADPANQKSLIEHARRYPAARVILAHAGRSFCSRHAVEGVRALRSCENLFFDTSAICESAALEAVLKTVGPRRLLYGSDFPVSQFVGRCVSIGDGFLWVDEETVDFRRAPFAQPILLGLESLLAVQAACGNVQLSSTDVERIFHDNACELMTLAPRLP